MRDDGTSYVVAKKPFVERSNPDDASARRRQAAADAGKENSLPDAQSVEEMAPAPPSPADAPVPQAQPQPQTRFAAVATTTAPFVVRGNRQQRSVSPCDSDGSSYTDSRGGALRPQSAPAARSSSTDARRRMAAQAPAPEAGPTDGMVGRASAVGGGVARLKQGALRNVASPRDARHALPLYLSFSLSLSLSRARAPGTNPAGLVDCFGTVLLPCRPGVGIILIPNPQGGGRGGRGRGGPFQKVNCPTRSST